MIDDFSRANKLDYLADRALREASRDTVRFVLNHGNVGYANNPSKAVIARIRNRTGGPKLQQLWKAGDWECQYCWYLNFSANDFCKECDTVTKHRWFRS